MILFYQVYLVKLSTVGVASIKFQVSSRTNSMLNLPEYSPRQYRGTRRRPVVELSAVGARRSDLE